MTKLKTVEGEAKELVNLRDANANFGYLTAWVRNNRANTLAVLNQSLVEKEFDPETKVMELIDPDGVTGYNYAVREFKALLQETLGEGK